MPSRRALPLALLAALLALPSAAAPPASAARPCTSRADEVRYDDGRLLVERSERAAGSGGDVRERWWTCWRPTGRRSLILDVRHAAGVDDRALQAVRAGHFVVLSGGAQLTVSDARRGRRTATLDLRGAVHELVVSTKGNAAALEDNGTGSWLLIVGSRRRSCVEDAGPPKGSDGSTFGRLRVHGERLSWFRDGIQFGTAMDRVSC